MIQRKIVRICQLSTHSTTNGKAFFRIDTFNGNKNDGLGCYALWATTPNFENFANKELRGELPRPNNSSKGTKYDRKKSRVKFIYDY